MTNSSKSAEWGAEFNDKKRILLFGGAFDPPHKGHVNLLENAVAATAPGLVLVVPEGTAPHKEASTTPWALRAEMCRCFLPVFPGIIISDMEQRRGGKSYTYNTVCQVEEEYPAAPVFLLLGGDMLASFFTWYRWKDLLQRVTLVAAPRSAGERRALQNAAQALEEAGGKVLFAPGPVVAASSSGIRAVLEKGDTSVLALVPPPVRDVICREGLYRPALGTHPNRK